MQLNSNRLKYKSLIKLASEIKLIRTQLKSWIHYFLCEIKLALYALQPFHSLFIDYLSFNPENKLKFVSNDLGGGLFLLNLLCFQNFVVHQLIFQMKFSLY